MEIIIKDWEDSGYGTHERMFINGECHLSVHPLSECPEDAIIGRDLVSCSDVAHFMKLAYEAGKNGEEFVVHFQSVGEEEC